MLDINMADVISVLNSCRPYLIAIGVILVLAIIATIAVKKLQKPHRKLTRSLSWLAALLAIVIVVNMICFGPMNTLISLATGSGVIEQGTMNDAMELCEHIAEEGIVLLKNDRQFLPLAASSRLNVFGWATISPCYGGTGSGALSGKYPTVTLEEGLENAGFELNTELSDFYRTYRSDGSDIGMNKQNWALPEPPASSYSSELLANAKDFSDTAVVVISRVGGEGSDIPMDVSAVAYENNSEDYADFESGEHYLQLSASERDMLELVCRNFDRVAVIYNGANTFELGFVNEFEQIQAVIWCPGTGQTGFNALGRILNGSVNPSGKTVDTFAADLTAAPAFRNFGAFEYDNMEEHKVSYIGAASGKLNVRTPSFVHYVEGIYVGYRFYETAAVEGLIDYDSTVVYPFGHGLSYTTFEQQLGGLAADGTTISFDVTVTNTGSQAGKDVVQIYYNPPYTNGGIEKASANLIYFAKTEMLEPGASQVVHVSWNNVLIQFYRKCAGRRTSAASEYSAATGVGLPGNGSI